MNVSNKSRLALITEDYKHLQELEDSRITMLAKLALYEELSKTVKLFINNANINMVAYQYAPGRMQDLKNALKALEGK